MDRGGITVRALPFECLVNSLYTYLDMTPLEQHYDDDGDDDNLRNNNSSICQ